MPRRARAIFPDLAVHIVHRGHNRERCFFREADFLFYLSNLRELARRYECALHAYCLMTNHVHLLVTPRQRLACARLMKNLAQRYAQYVNRERSRSGSLWEGRFRSSIAQSERYVLACYRYIELNPVRAGMVSAPLEYPWSSHRDNALGDPGPALQPHAQYLALASERAARRNAYLTLFDSALPADTLKEIRTAVNSGSALGDASFRGLASHAAARRPPTRDRSQRLFD